MSAYLLQKTRPSEDALTGLVVDLLRAWPNRDTLRALVGAATPFSAGAIALPEFERLTVESWPSWRCGEPDVVVLLHRDGGACRVLVLEMKLGAPKSGSDEEPVPASEVTKDQLAKYQREAVDRWPGVPVTVVYLTHHAMSPDADLSQSLASMVLPEQGAITRLAWCSWRDVEEGLGGLGVQRGDAPFRAYAEGLVAVLRSLGMFRFRGKWGSGRRHAGSLPNRLWWATAATRPIVTVRDAYRWSPPGVPSPRARPLRKRSYRWTLPSSPPTTARSFFRRSK